MGHAQGFCRATTEKREALFPVIELISRTEASLWEIDAHCYAEPNRIKALLELASAIRGIHAGMSDILVTKIMLGVFGNVPAFDTNFKRGFRVSVFGPKALKKIATFYQEHADAIDAHRVSTLDFVSGQPTQRRYTRAKVIDMVFFIQGMA